MSCTGSKAVVSLSIIKYPYDQIPAVLSPGADELRRL